MAVYTFKVTTNGEYRKVEDLCDISFVDDTLYSIQILGSAKLTYSSTTPGEDDGYLINFTRPFSYKKKTGEDLYIKTGVNIVTMTIGD